MGNLVPETECVVSVDTGDDYNFSTFGTDTKLPWAYIAWLCAFVVTVPISFFLSFVLGKTSANYICVPMVSSDTFKLREEKHKDVVNFSGFAVRAKAVIKAVSLSGIAITIVNTWITMGKFTPCAGYESVNTTMIFAWIASFVGYIMVWKIDVSLSVTKLKIWQRLLWVFSEKLIILICGSSFVRVIYIQTDAVNGKCYCSNDQLMIANIFTIVYIALFPLVWIVNRLRLKALIVLVLQYAYSQYICCASSNCCCEVNAKAPTGPQGKAFLPCIKACGWCCSKVSSGIAMSLVPAVMFVVTPFICLYVRFTILSDKWNNKLHAIDEMDVSDIVFIWIVVVAFTFFIVVCVEKVKNKVSPPKDEKEVALHANLGKENEKKEDEKDKKKRKDSDAKKEDKKDKKKRKESDAKKEDQKKRKESDAKKEAQKKRKESDAKKEAKKKRKESDAKKEDKKKRKDSDAVETAPAGDKESEANSGETVIVIEMQENESAK